MRSRLILCLAVVGSLLSGCTQWTPVPTLVPEQMPSRPGSTVSQDLPRKLVDVGSVAGFGGVCLALAYSRDDSSLRLAGSGGMVASIDAASGSTRTTEMLKWTGFDEAQFDRYGITLVASRPYTPTKRYRHSMLSVTRFGDGGPVTTPVDQANDHFAMSLDGRMVVYGDGMGTSAVVPGVPGEFLGMSSYGDNQAGIWGLGAVAIDTKAQFAVFVQRGRAARIYAANAAPSSARPSEYLGIRGGSDLFFPDPPSGQLLYWLVAGAAFSPRRDYLAVVGDDTLYLVNLATGRIDWTQVVATRAWSRVNLTFDPSGELLAIGGSEGLTIFSVSQRKAIYRWDGGEIVSARFSHDASRLAFSTLDGGVYVKSMR